MVFYCVTISWYSLISNMLLDIRLLAHALSGFLPTLVPKSLGARISESSDEGRSLDLKNSKKGNVVLSFSQINWICSNAGHNGVAQANNKYDGPTKTNIFPQQNRKYFPLTLPL